jgi:acyl carrier protein
MVPSLFMFVDEMPLTPNGKINRKALPSPDGLLQAGEYIAPEGDIECKLAAIWSGLLKIDEDKISADADFFRLGGHSLLSVRLITGISNEFEVKLPVNTVFNLTTLREQAVHIAMLIPDSTDSEDLEADDEEHFEI